MESSSAVAGWRDVVVGGKPGPVFEPKTLRSPTCVVLYLHGHALITLRDNPVYTALLERHGLICVCPPGGRGWWTDRPTSDFDANITPLRYLEDHVLPWIAATWGVTTPHIPLVGVSMGGQGALRMAYREPARFPIVAALAPAIDYYQWYGRGLPLDALYPDAESARQDSALLYLVGAAYPRHQLIVCDPADDEWYPSAEKLVGKLTSSGIPHASDLSTTAGGHTWDYFNHMAERVVGFVVESLERERRRLDVTGI